MITPPRHLIIRLGLLTLGPFRITSEQKQEAISLACDLWRYDPEFASEMIDPK